MARFFLDAGVPDRVAKIFKRAGHETILHREVLPDSTPDDQVCANAFLNEAILVALDKDMKRAPRRYGKKLDNDRFKSLERRADNRSRGFP